MTENAIKNQLYGEIPQDGRLYMYCGQANLELGYLIIAESMLQRSVTYPEIEIDTHRLLALVYRDQGHFS